jgi:hypothetical protein
MINKAHHKALRSHILMTSFMVLVFGTNSNSHVILAEANLDRKRWKIYFPPSGVNPVPGVVER